MTGQPFAPGIDDPTSPASEAQPIADLYLWSRQQADWLRAGRFDLVDGLNVADEIEDVGHSEYDKLESALAVLLQHILKWDFQPERRTRSCVLTIEEQRARVSKQLKRNPSLKAKLDVILADAYGSAKRRAYSETELRDRTFPDVLAYDWIVITVRPFKLDREGPP